jgi:hypothetical protein
MIDINGRNMPQTVEPKPEFRNLSEDDIMRALGDTDPSNPIAVEVARLITAYSENFRAHCERIGRIPESILTVKPHTAIEGVAMRLTTETIRQELQG